MPEIVVKTVCPICKKYYELDCKLEASEIALRNEGEIPCPLCQEGIEVWTR